MVFANQGIQEIVLKIECSILKLEVEGGSSRSHSLENSVWKRLLTCRGTDKYLIDPKTGDTV
jgi:hypothetical protein